METFERIENKYLLTEEQYEAFVKGIADHMKMDKFGADSLISNIYFDDMNNDIIRESIEKPVYKEKLRIRGYGEIQPDTKVFVELKKKYEGVVYKRRVSIPYRDIDTFLRDDDGSQVGREIRYAVAHHNLQPAICLSYNRTAYEERDGGKLRLTIDKNIRARRDELSLLAGANGEPLFSSDIYLLEIKTAGAYPLWLASLLSRNHIYKTSFSKYGAFYKKELAS